MENDKQNENNKQKSVIKNLFIITVAGVSEWTIFLSNKIIKEANLLEIIGYDISKLNMKEVLELLYNSGKDIDVVAKEYKLEPINISYPWGRVISINNLLYKKK